MPLVEIHYPILPNPRQMDAWGWKPINRKSVCTHTLVIHGSWRLQLKTQFSTKTDGSCSRWVETHYRKLVNEITFNLTPLSSPANGEFSIRDFPQSIQLCWHVDNDGDHDDVDYGNVNHNSVDQDDDEDNSLLAG